MRYRRRGFRALNGCLAVIALSCTPVMARDGGGQGLTYVQIGKLLADPATAKVEAERTLVIKDGQILRIDDGYTAEPGATIVDLRQAFVLPGLIDCHVHLLSGGAGPSHLHLAESPARMALRSARNARATLRAGFTTVADLGGDNEAIFALRDAIAAGDVDGPRIIAAGTLVTPDGGDSDVHGVTEEVAGIVRPPTVCSGVEGCRQAVRRQINRGADIIKVTATGGVLAAADTGVGQQFFDDELQAIAAAAHQMNRRVTAHAHDAVGIKAALRAGFDSIEHGTFNDAEAARLFRANGAYLIPTLMAGAFVTKRADDPNWRTAIVRAKAKLVGPAMIDGVRRARLAHVRIAFGTDSGVTPHGANAQEFSLLVQAGFEPIDAIRTATTAAADHLGIAGDAGRLMPGRRADLVGVVGDPTQDVAVLEQPRLVMKSGKVIRNEGVPVVERLCSPGGSRCDPAESGGRESSGRVPAGRTRGDSDEVRR